MTAIYMGAAGSMIESVELVSLVNHQVDGARDTSGGSGTATAIWTLASDGRATEAMNVSTGTDAITAAAEYNATDWFLAKPSGGVGSSWEARWNLDSSQSGFSDVFSTPFAANTWTDISVGRSWQLQDTCNNCETTPPARRTFTVEIRDVSTMTIQATGQITLVASLFGP